MVEEGEELNVVNLPLDQPFQGSVKDEERLEMNSNYVD